MSGRGYLAYFFVGCMLHGSLGSMENWECGMGMVTGICIISILPKKLVPASEINATSSIRISPEYLEFSNFSQQCLKSFEYLRLSECRTKFESLNNFARSQICSLFAKSKNSI